MALRSDDFHDVRMTAPEESAHRDRCQEVAEQDLLPGDRPEDSLREQHRTHEKAEFEDHKDQQDAEARVGSPLVLRLLFAVWVCSPFAALLTGRAMSESWRPSMRAALHAVTLLIASGSSLAYVYFALGAARPATAAFVLITPASWLFAAVALGAAAALSKEIA